MAVWPFSSRPNCPSVAVSARGLCHILNSILSDISANIPVTQGVATGRGEHWCEKVCRPGSGPPFAGEYRGNSRNSLPGQSPRVGAAPAPRRSVPLRGTSCPASAGESGNPGGPCPGPGSPSPRQGGSRPGPAGEPHASARLKPRPYHRGTRLVREGGQPGRWPAQHRSLDRGPSSTSSAEFHPCLLVASVRSAPVVYAGYAGVNRGTRGSRRRSADKW